VAVVVVEAVAVAAAAVVVAVVVVGVVASWPAAVVASAEAKSAADRPSSASPVSNLREFLLEDFRAAFHDPCRDLRGVLPDLFLDLLQLAVLLALYLRLFQLDLCR
jgi:hypothetical protein